MTASDPDGGLAALSGAAIAFDLDGTLVDTAPDLVQTLNLLLREEGVPPLAFDEARGLIGGGARRMMERGFEVAGVSLPEDRLDQLFGRFLDHYVAHIADGSRPFPGVERTLERLNTAGAKLVVCTNKRTDLSVALLDALDMSHHFAAIVGPDAAGARKPDPKHLQAAIAAAGGDPGRALMVGDSSFDARTARAAGVPLVLVSFGYTDVPAAELEPDALIHHFDDLTAACLRLLGACSR